VAKDRAPWIKLWGTYVETSTLRGMDPAHRWVGVCVMLLVRTASDVRGEQTTWAVHENDEPRTIRDIADYASVPDKVARVAIADFVRRGFMTLREDGAVGLPKFWKYQESPDAKRKREQRVRGHSGDMSGPLSQQEDRGQSSSLRSEPPLTPPDESEHPDPTRESAKRVLAALSDARLELVPGARRLKATDTNLGLILARLREGEPESDLLLVVAHEAAKVRRGGSASKWLNPSTPFRPGNWPTRLADALESAPRSVATTSDTTAADLRAERDARRAQVELEERLQAGGDA
jgi:hypothetical protein